MQSKSSSACAAQHGGRSASLEYLPKPIDVESHKDKIVSTAGETSMLARVICEEKLPVAIRLRKGFSSKEFPTALKNGEMLLLCFMVEVPMVHATLGKNTECRLPIYANQLYEKLPLGKLVIK